MIGVPEINKIIRKILFPTLRANGFSNLNPRNSWAYHEDCIWVFNLCISHKRYSPLTAIYVFLGIYYKFISETYPPKIDKTGRLIPEEWRCHVRNELRVDNLDQSQCTKMLYSPAEVNRRDIWWILPDGNNIEEAIDNVKSAFLNQGMQWFNDFTNLEYAFKCIDHLAPDHMIEKTNEEGMTYLIGRGHIQGEHAAREFAKYMNYQDRVEAYVAWEETRKLEYLERAYQYLGVLGTIDLAQCFELSSGTIHNYGNSFENLGFVFTRTDYPGHGPRWDKYWKISKPDSTDDENY
jgi:hypothetical protein